MTLYKLINANDAVTLYARCQSVSTGNTFAQSDVSTVSVVILDEDADTGTTLSPAVSAVVSNSLSTINWTQDRTGFNVAYTIAGSNFATADHSYLVTMLLTPVIGQPQQVVANIQTRPQ